MTTLLSKESFCQEDSSKDALYRIVPKRKDQIPRGDFARGLLWALFGNDDDGIYGEGAAYRVEEANDFCKACRFWCRNPFHNLFFYVFGSADRVNKQVVLIEAGDEGVILLKRRCRGKNIYGGRKRGFLFALHGSKPFISIRFHYCRHRVFEFYIGWRERGNLGLKFHPYKRVSTHQ